MSGRKNIRIAVGAVLSVSLIAAALTALLVSFGDSRHSFQLLNGILGEVLEREPETEQLLSGALKEYTDGQAADTSGKDVLSAWGYQPSDFGPSFYGRQLLCGAAGFLTGALLFAAVFMGRNKKEAGRITKLAAYLEQVNMGKAVLLSVSGEDEFSKLEDEIYKTVTFLYQTRDAAMQTKNKFAENLSNIAHQIRTPITAISLSVQTMEGEIGGKGTDQIKKQLLRLTHLEEALLVLSRLDAGTLPLRREKTDVFTMLVLAADQLQELLTEAGVSVEIPEAGETGVSVDRSWTTEAVMNLLKNCMEHNPGGRIHTAYSENPLYTEIIIWDEGPGFAKEDIPHLFERFYRGKNAKPGSIGIGLALAREIVERQNGVIHAKNMPEGGACFEIRFYSH